MLNNLFNDVKKFYKDSIDGVYYAPFDVNSKNINYIPEETYEWFEKLNDILIADAQLTAHGDHHFAIKCFYVLSSDNYIARIMDI